MMINNQPKNRFIAIIEQANVVNLFVKKNCDPDCLKLNRVDLNTSKLFSTMI